MSIEGRAYLMPIALGISLLGLAGCKSVGPSTIQRDRLHYSGAVAQSWKEQLLLNIVKTRYGDAPAFLEVVSVVSGYSLETGISLNGQVSPEDLRGDTFGAVGASAQYTERPTISYAPMTGERYARSLLAPIPLDALWSVIQGGAPAELLTWLALDSLAGHYNFGLYGGHLRPSTPSFDRTLEAMHALQENRVVTTELIRDTNQFQVWFRFQPGSAANPAVTDDVAELKTLLNIARESDRVRVVFGTATREPDSVAMRTRSLMQILSTLGAGVQIPAEDLARGGVVPAEANLLNGRFTVHSGTARPGNAFVSVPYRNHWFWVDSADLPSKTTLSVVTILFNFLDGGGSKSAPVLTIPAS